MSDLSTMFDPNRVAVIGATDRPGAVGRALMENLSSFPGDVIPVNPNRASVLGMPCYDDIADVPDTGSIDLAIVVVPPTAVNDVVREAGEAGVSNLIVITAGFGEAGPDGRERERELVAIAERYDLSLIGPNCVGILSTSARLNATFVQGRPVAGGISLLSQSGAFISAVLSWAEQHGIGFNHVVSLGNEAVVDELDVLRTWRDDPNTDVVLAYLEDIEDGQRFVETARETTAETPVVVIKAGRTAAGRDAAASHTGSIAGRDAAYQAGFHQAGVLRALDVQTAFDFARVLAGQPLPNRGKVAIVTNGGGPGVLAADAIDESHLDLAAFDEPMRDRLRAVLPDQADLGNPLDIIGDADVDRFRDALDAVLEADAVGAAIVISVPTALFDVSDLATVVGALHERHEVPVVTCFMGGADADRAEEILDDHRIPNFFDPARAVRGLDALAQVRDVRTRTYQPPTTFEVDRSAVRSTIDAAIERGDRHLSVEAMELLAAYGVPIPTGDLAESESAAITIARDIGGPVVMKLASPDILHKSDIGGVEVGVPPDDVDDAYRLIVERARRHDPDARIHGVRVEELIDLDGATETIVGANRDPQFGHLVMFGLGGIFVEVFEDTAVRVAPVSERDARDMTEEIRAAPLLRGARGRPPADLDAVVETIQRISQLVSDFPAIAELDINPLVVAPDGVQAIDFRMTLDRDERSVSADSSDAGRSARDE